jgi:inner membrane protein
MATPIGHALAGYAVHSLFRGHERSRLLWLSLFMAIAPDFDFLPGLLSGKPLLYHQQITHSFGFALLVSLGAVVMFRKKGCRVLAISGLCFLSYTSHLLIDFFGPDARLPYGQPLFWPVSNRHFISSIALFRGMHHASSTNASTGEWISGVFDLYNIGAIALEIVFIGPLILIPLLLRNGRRRWKETT